MIESWKKAKEDLNIEIEIPFTQNGNEYPMLIKYFGSSKGTIVLNINELDQNNLIEIEGFFTSAINPLVYQKYERGLFIDTLEDWGWFGPQSLKPDWYTGKYYKSAT